MFSLLVLFVKCLLCYIYWTQLVRDQAVCSPYYSDQLFFLALVAHCQQLHFDNSSSLVRNFSPFTDNLGIIRVGGRLKNAFLSFDMKYPIIIPKENPMAIILILHYHEIITFLDNCFIIRKSGIFIEGCRKLIYSAINKGVLCQRLRGIPKMADHLLTDYKSIQCSQIMAL